MTSALDHRDIDATISPIEDELIDLRRDIHRWPEPAGEERRTAALVAELMRAEGLAVSTGVGGHGVMAVLDGDRPGPTVAYRADMDAVGDTELFDSAFRSQVPGVAHLCGHDLHTAIGVGVAQVLGRLRTHLTGRVVFLFQPAEETLAGARAMIADGVLDRTAPREIYALHCAPLPTGTFAVSPGFGMAGQDRYDIEIPVGSPPEDRRRLTAAIDALSTLRPPRTPEQFTRLIEQLRTPDGPLARFVYAQSARTTRRGGELIQVWLRAWPDDRYPQLREDLERLVRSIDGATITFPAPPFPAMISSPSLSESAADSLGRAPVMRLSAAFPFNGEDFALFLQQVPGAMVFLGVADAAAGMNGILHAPDFAADERAIAIGVRGMAGLLADRLHTLASNVRVADQRNVRR